MRRILYVGLAVAMVTMSARDAAPATTLAPLTRAQVKAFMASPTRHVRAVDKRVSGAIAEGLRRSGTFAQLVLALDRSDVIVYVETGRKLPATVAGRLLLVARPEGPRYLRVQVTEGPHPHDLIALVAHELRHALEVAESADVRDDKSLIALYEKIGHLGRGAHHFDTLAAQDTAKQVRSELAG
jgi:hypothetical protein